MVSECPVPVLHLAEQPFCTKGRRKCNREYQEVDMTDQQMRCVKTKIVLRTYMSHPSWMKTHDQVSHDMTCSL